MTSRSKAGCFSHIGLWAAPRMTTSRAPGTVAAIWLADARAADAIVLTPDDERRRRDGRQLVTPVLAQDLGGGTGHPNGARASQVAQEGREDDRRSEGQRPQQSR